MRFIAGLDRTSSAPVVMVPAAPWREHRSSSAWRSCRRKAEYPVELLFRYGAMYSDATRSRRILAADYRGLPACQSASHSGQHALPGDLGRLRSKGGWARFISPASTAVRIGSAERSSATSPMPELRISQLGRPARPRPCLGALLALRLLGLDRPPWSFFVINIGLNIALAVEHLRIDWGAHLGGFFAGMVACVCLDLLERMFAAATALQVSGIRESERASSCCGHGCGILLDKMVGRDR